jgi:hypothetical protein
MKQRNWFTAIALIAIIGFSMAGCDTGTSSGGSSGYNPNNPNPNNPNPNNPNPNNPNPNNPNTFIVTFNANGGTGTAPNPITVQAGASTALPGGGTLTKSGSTFAGWNTNAAGTGTNYNAGSPYTPTSNITLFAKWDSGGTVVVPTGDVTIIPATAVAKGRTQRFNTTVTGSAVTWEVTGGGPGTGISQDGRLTVGANETAATLTVKATSTADPSKSGTVIVPVAEPVHHSVNDQTSWIAAVNGVRNGGNNTAHIITVTNDFSVTTSSASDYTFGDVTGITVSIEGEGAHTITAASSGRLLYIDGDQTVIIKDITLQGSGGTSSYQLVRIEYSFNFDTSEVINGTFIMEGSASVTGNSYTGVYLTGNFIMQDNAEVTGNTLSSQSAYGGGVNVALNGIFIMQDNAAVTYNSVSGGSILNNYFGGGGVCLNDGIFIMRGSASVSNNSVSGSGTINSAGGGVCITGGDFIMEGGTISDNTVTSTYFDAYGGGVYVNASSDGGTFTMYNGTISSNTIESKYTAYGGGVHGIFVMENGAITGNTVNVNNTGSTGYVDAYGGGVYGTLTMRGGTISNNTINAGRTYGSTMVTGAGGGVYGSFTMEGGTISGNTLNVSNSGNSSSITVRGGGVYVRGTLTKTGGTIYGNNAPEDLKNTADGGQGHAVYNYAYTGGDNYRNVTAGPADNSTAYGFWTNEQE